MAVPKEERLKQEKNKRRTHFKISVPGMTECPNCRIQIISPRM